MASLPCMALGRHRKQKHWRGATVIGAAVAVAVTGMTQSAGASTPPTNPSGPPVAGTATNYTLTSGGGNCSYPSPPANGMFAAVSPAEYAGGAACGKYVDVTGPHGTVPVEVTDQCPECAPGHIDLSQGAFARIAPLPEGQVNVTYQPVANPPLTAPVAIRVKEGSSPYWLALLPMNTGNPLASVQVQTAWGGWTGLVRSGYGYWIAQQGAGPGPFTVRLTDTAGHTVTIGGITLSPGTVQYTGTWMY